MNNFIIPVIGILGASFVIGYNIAKIKNLQIKKNPKFKFFLVITHIDDNTGKITETAIGYNGIPSDDEIMDQKQEMMKKYFSGTDTRIDDLFPNFISSEIVKDIIPYYWR